MPHDLSPLLTVSDVSDGRGAQTAIIIVPNPPTEILKTKKSYVDVGWNGKKTYSFPYKKNKYTYIQHVVEDLVEASSLHKLRVILRPRVLRGAYVLMMDIHIYIYT